MALPDVEDSVGLADNLCLPLYLVGDLGFATLADSLQLPPNFKGTLRFASNLNSSLIEESIDYARYRLRLISSIHLSVSESSYVVF